MKMTRDKFDDRTSKYIWEQLIPDTEGLSTKCLFGAVEKSGALRTAGMLGDALRALGVMDKETVDIDRLRAVAYGAAEAGGGEVVLRDSAPLIRIPRPAVDKYLKFLETETVA